MAESKFEAAGAGVSPARLFAGCLSGAAGESSRIGEVDIPLREMGYRHGLLVQRPNKRKRVLLEPIRPHTVTRLPRGTDGARTVPLRPGKAQTSSRGAGRLQGRPDFAGEQLETAEPARAVVPVVRDQDERAELADARAQLAKLPCDFRRIADDQDFVQKIIEIAVVIGLVGVALPHPDSGAAAGQ